MSEGPPLLDEALLGELIDAVGAAGVRAIIELFLGECRELTETIVAAGDIGAAQRAAHSLKSSAGQLGALALARAALAVETASAAELPAHAAALAGCAEPNAAALTARLARF